MDSRVLITYHNNRTFDDFMASSRTSLGHYQRVNAEAGTIIVLANLTTGTVFGICTLANWEGTLKPCRPHSSFDAQIYGEGYTAYNKYKLRIKNLRILKEPVSFAQIKVLVGGSDSVRQTNIWKGTQLNYARPFVTGDDKAPVERFNIWAKSLL